ncbi:MAG TPA: peptidoglycan-binding domain-containing protein [Chthoniobacteraceae bacterium]|jgi:hypothetical protein|nr:Peptidoglycan-binding domain 1 protein [Chthoniobacter sp.]HEV7868510.1 peptidoglycan-binding domain-containing protein [Chthoniobacteraceae bacterium]
MIRRAACVFLLFGMFSAQADEQVRAVQEELRRRSIYNGDIDGRRSPELGEALKRYQKRKGFSETGQEDPDTLRSLALVPRSPNDPPPKEISWPAETVLKSDEKIDVAQEAAALAEETGIAPESVALGETQVVAGRKTRSAKRQPSRRVTAASKGKRSRPLAQTAARGTQMIDERELRSFIEGYIRALRDDDLQEELRFYSDRVNYFANGEVDRRLVERTLRAYYKRWPKRRYSLLEGLRYAFDPARAQIVVTFNVSFSLKNDRQAVKGQTENRLFINAATADPRIVAIEERRIRG